MRQGLFFHTKRKLKLFVGGLIKFEQTPVIQRLSLFGLPLFSCKLKQKKVLKVFGIPIWFHDRTNDFFDYLSENIESGHDHVYILRHNIGETFVYLSYLKSWIKSNKSKKPLIIVWREKDVSLYKMFLDSDCSSQFLFIPHSDHNIFLRKKCFDLNGMRFFTPTYQVAENLKIEYQSNPKTNFHDFILQNMGVALDTEPSNFPRVSNEVVNHVLNQVQSWSVGDRPIALLLPLANSLEELPVTFWGDLCQKLRSNNYYVVVNSEHPIQGIEADKFYWGNIEEVYQLASQSKKIISLASGIGVLLSSIGVPITLLYTDFRNKKIGYDSDLALKIYSVKHLKLKSYSHIKEIDMSREKTIDI